VKYQLVYTPSFVRAARRLVSKSPRLAHDVEQTLKVLSDDPFHPSLRTHKLKGELKDSWACSAGYDLRVVFKFVTAEGGKAVLLQTIGTHDEVY
jgi:mRNA interferase YafQ